MSTATITTTPPGYPGIAARWTSSAKDGCGTSVSNACRLWFTISHGIINEVYHPTLDHANNRDMGFIVTDGSDFFSEEKRDTNHRVEPVAQGVPAYRLINTCKEGRYRITKTVFSDPNRDVLVQQVQFEALRGKIEDYHLYLLVAPHLRNQGAGNDGWVGDCKGVPMLYAFRDGMSLATGSSSGWLGTSCGYVGISDGWQDLHAHNRMTWFYPEARDGNIALTGEIDLRTSDGAFVVATAIDATPAEAGQHVRTTLLCDARDILNSYIEGWNAYQARCLRLEGPSANGFDLYRVSTSILKIHDGKQFPGGLIASLSIPWGYAKGDHDLGGYHLVWPRDQVEATGALLAAGNQEAARETLLYLMSTQEADGHWVQNMWLDGTPYWKGTQNDETAFVILLAGMLRRESALDGIDVWPSIRSAVRFLLRKGPITQQDRWEENAGLTSFTLAVEIAALLVAADFAEGAGEGVIADYMRETADIWNSTIEEWTYVRNTDLAKKAGVDGYYVRIAPPEVAETLDPGSAKVVLKNLPPGDNTFPAGEIVSPDALALVRFGLRAANDPRILNTVKVIDAVLKTETTTGPVWHRYNHDGYGEHDDGCAFDGTGVGRGWPLLAGERAHYELAMQNREEAERLLKVMATQTSAGGLLPEQVWDGADIPERELFNGHPSGSGMPLVWAHSEFIKVARSLRDGAIFDAVPQAYDRYVVRKVEARQRFWRFEHPCSKLTDGRQLRIEVRAPAEIRWTHDGWTSANTVATVDTGVGLHRADLPTDSLPIGATIAFTFFWPEANRWEGRNFEVRVA